MLASIFSDPQKFVRCGLLFLAYVLSLSIFLKLSHSLYELHFDKNTGRAEIDIDFNAYMTGALIVKNKPKSLYNAEVQRHTQEIYLGKSLDAFLSFRNTPLVAFMFIPYTNISTSSAYLVNYFVQILLTILYILLLTVFVGYKKFLIPLALIFLPTVCCPLYGQIAIVIALVLLVTYHLVRSDKYFWAGVVSSFLLLKIQYIIFIPYLFLIIKRKKQYFVGLIISLFLLVIVDTLIYRDFYLVDYVIFLVESEKAAMGTDLTGLFTVTAFLRNTGFPNNTSYLITTGLYIASLALVGIKKSKVSLEKIFASIIIFILSLNFHTALVDLIFVLIPIFILANIEENKTNFLILILFLVPMASTFGLQGLAGAILFITALCLLNPFSKHKLPI